MRAVAGTVPECSYPCFVVRPLIGRLRMYQRLTVAEEDAYMPLYMLASRCSKPFASHLHKGIMVSTVAG